MWKDLFAGLDFFPLTILLVLELYFGYEMVYYSLYSNRSNN